MNKALAIVVVVALSVLLVVGYRTMNRADAAAGDCYSDAPGPATPTICS